MQPLGTDYAVLAGSSRVAQTASAARASMALCPAAEAAGSLRLLRVSVTPGAPMAAYQLLTRHARSSGNRSTCDSAVPDAAHLRRTVVGSTGGERGEHSPSRRDRARACLPRRSRDRPAQEYVLRQVLQERGRAVAGKLQESTGTNRSRVCTHCKCSDQDPPSRGGSCWPRSCSLRETVSKLASSSATKGRSPPASISNRVSSKSGWAPEHSYTTVPEPARDASSQATPEGSYPNPRTSTVRFPRPDLQAGDRASGRRSTCPRRPVRSRRSPGVPRSCSGAGAALLLRGALTRDSGCSALDRRAGPSSPMRSRPRSRRATPSEAPRERQAEATSARVALSTAQPSSARPPLAGTLKDETGVLCSA